MSLDPNDLIGYFLAIISIIFAIVQHFRNKIDSQRLENAILRKDSEIETARLKLSESMQKVHNIAFNSLLTVKNQPTDWNTLHGQLGTLKAFLTSIQKIAQEEVPNKLFEGEIFTGGKLGEIEYSEQTKEVWLVSNDLRPDISEPELLKGVAQKCARGCRYFYIAPSDLETDHFQLLLENLMFSSKDVDREALLENVCMYRLSRSDFRQVFSGGGIALYVMRPSATGASHASVMGFEEVVFPNERRGSMWQRQSEDEARATYRRLFNGLASEGAERLEVAWDDGCENLQVK